MMNDSRMPDEQDTRTLRKIFEERHYSFQYGFSDQIMRKIQNQKTPSGVWYEFVDRLYLFFRWLAFGSSVATVVFLFMLFQEGALSGNGLYGFAGMDFPDAVTFNIYSDEK